MASKFFKKFALTGNSDGSYEDPKNKDKNSKEPIPMNGKVDGTDNGKKVDPKQPNPNNNKPNQPGPNQAKRQAPTKKSGGKILMWVLFITFFVLLIWSLFFTTPTYIATESDLFTINAEYEVVSENNVYEDSAGEQYIPAGTEILIDGVSTTLTEPFLDWDMNNNDATPVSGTDSASTTHVSRYSYDLSYGSLMLSTNWSSSEGSLYLSDNGGYAELWLYTVDTNGKKINYVIYFADNEQAEYYVSVFNDVALTGSFEIVTRAPQQPSWFWTFLLTWLPWLLFFVLGMWIVRKMMEKQGGQMNFGKSTAKMTIADKKFSDVAGYSEIKEELVEIVDFLKDPMKYAMVGARAPKGILITGPPGTGKTLMAKAVAGEAGIPFFSISGSDFVEMFVGVGASRVRDMFKAAKAQAPCLIFIDELDAVGRQRGAGVGGGNDEREQTLNQLLVEMDGFSPNAGIVVMGATNRPDVLDPAIKRPGRFDREVSMRLPDVREREMILKVHLKGKKLADDIEVTEIAERTPGFSGAQLENVVNEATILSIRHKKDKIDKELIDEAVDRVIAGPAKTDNIISKEEKELIAYHESGHAIIGLKVDGANIVRKITIVPRGDAGGYVLMTPKKEKFVTAKYELEARITSYMAGRAAEEIFFGKESVTTGAYADIKSATEIARAMVTEYGMSPLGPIQFEQREGSVFLGKQVSQHKKFSEETSNKIDIEVQKLIDNSVKEALKTIKANIDIVKILAQSLMIKETLTSEEINFVSENKKLPQSVIDFEKRKKEEHEKAEKAKKEAAAKAKADAKAKAEAEKKAKALAEKQAKEAKAAQAAKATTSVKPKIVDAETTKSDDTKKDTNKK